MTFFFIIITIVLLPQIAAIVYFNWKSKQLIADLQQKKHTLIEHVLVNIERQYAYNTRYLYHNIDLYIYEDNVVMIFYTRFFRKFYTHSIQFCFGESLGKLRNVSYFYDKPLLKSSSYRIELSVFPEKWGAKKFHFDMNLGRRNLDIPEILKRYNLPIDNTPKK